MGWADADLQQWVLTEEEYKETVRRYARDVGSQKGERGIIVCSVFGQERSLLVSASSQQTPTPRNQRLV